MGHTPSVKWADVTDAIQSNPHKHAQLQSHTASATVTSIPNDVAIDWLPGWTEDTTCAITDVIAYVLWVRDPLYRVAAQTIRRSMEMEEASYLLHASEAAWKQYNGRARSWVRKHLEEDLRHRAGGGEPAPDAWESVRTTKRAALLLDYVCILRGLRVALWWPDKNVVTVVPLTGVGAETHVNQINCLSNRMMLGMQIAGPAWPDLLLKAPSDLVWAPPASSPSIGANTVAQINERIQAITGVATEPKTGGRTVLWNRLMWLTLCASLNGKEVLVESEGS